MYSFELLSQVRFAKYVKLIFVEIGREPRKSNNVTKTRKTKVFYIFHCFITKNNDFSYFSVNAKKLLGSDSSRKVRFQILGNPQMLKNMFLTFRFDQKLWSVSIFLTIKKNAKFHSNRPKTKGKCST